MWKVNENNNLNGIVGYVVSKLHGLGWLSREMGCTHNHVYKIFSISSLDSDLILRIPKAMYFNFFQNYSHAFLDNLKARIEEEIEE